LGQTQHEYFINIQIAFQTYRKAFDTYITLQKFLLVYSILFTTCTSRKNLNHPLHQDLVFFFHKSNCTVV